MKVILTHDQSFVEAVKHTQITLAPGAFTISGLSYHADDPNCCPRYMIRQTATWKNGKLVLGPCQRRLA